ncbi:hypothetical protein [Shewanella baltica]|uniref:hypothetical protein n=1 Tax=Shewanella baltica TaxID=62322 RepID=UPI00217EDFEB|nr:hypothetical protein [Shewanella baltica]MCS6162405.1 hypothetical protein [Shewanella baltica]
MKKPKMPDTDLIESEYSDTDCDSYGEPEITLEDALFAQMASADRDYTEEHGHSEITDWDNMLECEVRHFNHQYGTEFDPVEMRYQYIERQEKKCGYN